MQDDPLVDVLRATVEALENAGIRYAVTGSVAGSIHGEPIQSLDVDIVLRMTPEQARQVATTLPQRFYRSAAGWKHPNNIKLARNNTQPIRQTPPTPTRNPKLRHPQ